MRVIAGSAKGLKLYAPNTSKVRPASDKVKGAIFNILGNIEDSKVLDLFAGSGSVGIEALSRGAKDAVFVELDRQIAESIQKNLENCHFSHLAKILRMEVKTALSLLSKKNESFHLIFVDPPYDKNLLNPTLLLVDKLNLLQSGGVLVTEHSPREMPETQETLEIFDQRQYGQTFISFLRKRD